MRRTYAVLAAALVVASCAAAAPPERPRPTSLLGGLPEAEAALVVYKSARVLAVYRHGRFDRRYSIVLGRSPEGHKRFQGDMRTPEGLYYVSKKRRHPRWRYFIAIDYPNESDKQAYDSAYSEGLVPVIRGESLDVGGGIGIHGNDRPEAQRAGTDWTQGCVAMSNADVTELYSLVEVGTPVLILP